MLPFLHTTSLTGGDSHAQIDAQGDLLGIQWAPGTGVSILRVDSGAPGDFVRVGGTACGGGANSFRGRAGGF